MGIMHMVLNACMRQVIPRVSCLFTKSFKSQEMMSRFSASCSVGSTPRSTASSSTLPSSASSLEKAQVAARRRALDDDDDGVELAESEISVKRSKVTVSSLGNDDDELPDIKHVRKETLKKVMNYGTGSNPPNTDEAKKLKPEENPARVRCPVCGGTYASRDIFKRHDRLKHRKARVPIVHRCNVPGCEKAFARSDQLKRHVFEVHGDPSSFKHKCQFCDTPFARFPICQNHERTCSKRKRVANLCNVDASKTYRKEEQI